MLVFENCGFQHVDVVKLLYLCQINHNVGNFKSNAYFTCIMKVQICVTEYTDSSSVLLLFFMMSGQALCKYCSSVGSSCFCYMRWLISLDQSLHCF